MEAIRFETTIGEEGIVRVPDMKEGDRVEVIVLKLPPEIRPRRKGGWAEGKITMLPGFDDPIPGMEEYM
jgi:hypothetical protein